MRIYVTDPVRDAIPDGVEVRDFDDYWRELGSLVKLQLRIGDSGLTWANIGVTHDANTIENPTLHRTISRVVP